MLVSLKMSNVFVGMYFIRVAGSWYLVWVTGYSRWFQALVLFLSHSHTYSLFLYLGSKSSLNYINPLIIFLLMGRAYHSKAHWNH